MIMDDSKYSLSETYSPNRINEGATRNRAYLHKYLFMGLFILLFASCRSFKDTTTGSLSDKQRNEQLRPLAVPQEGITDLTARITVGMDYNQHQLSLKGRLRMRRNEVIQVSLTAFGLVEVAFVEFTPQGVCVVDRMGKRYIHVDYSSGLLQRLGIDFPSIQALFWNKLFIPGNENIQASLGDFQITTSGKTRLVRCEILRYAQNDNKD